MGTAAIARGELPRRLAEPVCYPTVLLPSEGVAWILPGRDAPCYRRRITSLACMLGR